MAGMRSAALAAGLWVGLVGAAGALEVEGLPEGDLAAGEARYAENCVNCHGRTGRGMASFPAIQGRDAEFIAGRLLSYRAREMVGPNSALMFSLSDELTDQEIADLAAFIATAFP
ncbi:MAG: c-type cytochrome [Alkalilacustris sp.]